MEILKTLGSAGEPLSFTELRDRVGIRQGGQFNYHLDKLTGHFLAKTDDGYSLRRAGERVIEAILSGAVIEAPVMNYTELDQSCYYCGGPVAVNFAEEKVGVYCTDCDGNYGGLEDLDEPLDPAYRGRLGYMPLPPAGVRGRTPEEVLSAATIWGHLDLFTQGHGICPKCSARLDESVSICRDHDDSSGVCSVCNNRHAIQHVVDCSNCIFGRETMFMVSLIGTTELLAFMTSHDYNPISPGSELDFWEIIGDYDEELLSTDPFRAKFTFDIDEDALILTVNEDFNVVQSGETTIPETA